MQDVLKNFNISHFQNDLLNWYEKNKRDLPWRKDKDPYKVWVSEIMLQQTRVDTVIPYFYNFIDKFPTVHDLAKADEQDVLMAWEGLGYYSRARNLHHAVREVVSEYNGVVPNERKALGKLKGIGPYTRGAILSIAFDQPEPAVDGNVMRVLSRVLKIDEDIRKQKVRKYFEAIVREIIYKEDPSSFNQAIMELGALVCTPKAPQCMLCPVHEHCRAFAEGIEEELPVKSKAKKQRSLPYVALLIKNNEGKVVIEQRPEKGLLANMWQFPMVPIDEVGFDHIESYILGEYGVRIQLKRRRGNIKHVFSHIIWKIVVYDAETFAIETDDQRIQFVGKDELDQYPFPVPHQKMKKYVVVQEEQ
ncbi:MAG TPA: A/G-specific adenine glycosylase [Bacillota bacterium]